MLATWIKRLLVTPLVVLLGACTVLGPDYSAPEPAALPSSWDRSEREQASAEALQWWRQFNDPVLNTLVERGAAQNLSLEAAGLRIVQARAALGISDALHLPQQQQLSGNITELYQQENGFTNAGVNLDVGWELDIWGKYARAVESSEAQLYASIAAYRDVLVSITAEIARNYINYRTAQERAYLSRQNIAIQERVVDMTQVQYDAGNVSELDVQQARTQLYATRSALPALELAQDQARHALAVLLGTLPEQLEPLLHNAAPPPSNLQLRLNGMDNQPQTTEAFLAQYQAHSVIPHCEPELAAVDAQLVMRRPDLQVAELAARAQSARIGLTEADLYPQFFLFGSLGLSDTVRHGDSFSASNAVTAAIGPGFSWNILQYDRIRNRVRIEDAAFQESLSNYNQQVLRAVQEVSNAVSGYRNTVARSVDDYEAVKASIRAFNISANQYNNGLVSYQRLLSTVEKMTLREDVYAQTRGGIANQLVGLYKALGGGWQAFDTLPLVRPDSEQQMRERTDWGDYLDADSLRGGNRRE